jgi:Ca2+-binding RTX toxin-like protein
MTKSYFLSVLFFSLLALPFVSYAHCKGNHTGDHPHCVGGGSGNLGDDYTATDGVVFISPSDVGSFDYHIIGNQGNDEIYAGGGSDLIEGDDGSDQIFAKGGDDMIFGGTDDDTIQGGPGTDWLEGGDGHDRLIFSLGSFNSSSGQYEVDHYDGNLGNDYLHFRYNSEDLAESVLVDMTSNSYEAIVRDPSGTLVTVNGGFSGIETIWGTSGDDVLLGDDTNNELYADDGDNIIYGYGGNDYLGADRGNNVLYGGSGNDWINVSGNGILFGEAGDDLLEGHGGDDELHGGEGCDGYIFDLDFGTPTIMDFDYPYNLPACDVIYIAIHSRYRVDFRNVEINNVGNDIIIDVEVKRGGTGGTILLKDAWLKGVTVDESTFIFTYPERDCSRYWCSPWD